VNVNVGKTCYKQSGTATSARAGAAMNRWASRRYILRCTERDSSTARAGRREGGAGADGHARTNE